MATTLDIINGISQVVANSYDGATDEDGEPLKTGLQRDEEVHFTDRRVIDGFKVKISGDNLKLIYHSEMRIEQLHDNGFEDEVLQTISDVVSFIKKEYKKVTGNTLTLKEISKPDIEISNTSRIRSWVVATCVYEIGKVDKEDEDEDKEDLDKAVKKWLATGKETYPKAKKSDNDER